MTRAFNLLDEPWIPVRTHDGTVREVGLLDALIHAKEYAALAETAPPNLVALYRVLLAITHRVLTTQHGRWREGDRVRWFREGLPEASVRAYLEQWRERFWLFHPEQPFMQVPALAYIEETKDKLKPWTQIALESANGNTPVMFDHAMDEFPVGISPSQACISLLGFLQFTSGGLVKIFREADNAGPLSNTAAILPVGDSLLETLVLNLHPWSSSSAEDLPAWEMNPPGIYELKSKAKLATGPNDRYTRLTRAVLLVPEEKTDQIYYLRFGAGLALGDDPNASDPMAAYHIRKDGAPVRISFLEGRALWRDLSSLVPESSGKFDIPPSTLSWATNLYMEKGEWDRPVRVLAAGISSHPKKKAKLMRWRVSQIEFPKVLLIDQAAAASLRQKVQYADDLYSKLWAVCVCLIVATMPDPKNKETYKRAGAILDNSSCAATFFSTTERGLPQQMEMIASGEIDAAYQHWNDMLSEALHQAWRATCRSLGCSPAVLRAEARTFPQFADLLSALRAPLASSIQENTP